MDSPSETSASAVTPPRDRPSRREWVERLLPFASVAALFIILSLSTRYFLTLSNLSSVCRQTAVINNQGLGGVGPGQALVETMLVSDQPVFIERPTYSSNSPDYGATDSMGYSPTGF